MAANLGVEDALERLFLKLASIDNEEKMQTFLDKTIFTVMDLLATNNQKILDKGKEILAHLSRRIKNDELVKINVDIYMEYLKKQTHPVPLGLTLRFFKMGIDRMNDAEMVKYMPELLKLLKKKVEDGSKNTAYELTFIIIRGISLLGFMRIESWPSDIMDLFRDVSVKPIILQLLRDMTAFQYTHFEDCQRRAHLVTEGIIPGRESGIALGVYSDIILRLVVIKTNMTELKMGTLNFLAKDVYTEKESFPIYILGKSNYVDKVKDLADLQLRKVNIDECINDATIVNYLFLWYTGNQATNVREKIGVSDIPMKMAILPYLNRSKKAATTFPGNYKVAFGALQNDQKDLRPVKVQILGAQFLQSIVENMPPNFLPNFGPIIFKQITKLFHECEFGNVVAILYRSYGILGRKLPNLVTSNLALLNDTFEAITTAPEEVIGAIQDCLVEWLPSFAAIKDPAVINMLETVVAQFVKIDKCSLVALKYIAALIKSKSPVFRWLLVHCLNSRRHDLEKEAARLLQLSLSDQESLPDLDELVDLFHKNLKIENVTDALEAAEKSKKDVRKSKLTEKTHQIASTYILAVAASLAKCSGKFFGFLDDDLKVEELPKVAIFLKGSRPETVQKFVEIVLTSVWESTNTGSALLHICIFVLSCSQGTPNQWLVSACRDKLRTVTKSSNRYSVCNLAAKAFILLLERRQIVDEFQTTVAEVKANKDFVAGTVWIMALLSLEQEISFEYAADVQKALIALTKDGLEHPSVSLETALSALAEVLRLSAVGNEQKHLYIQKSRSAEDYVEAIDLLAKALVSRKDTITLKMKESAAACLGFLASIHESMAVTVVEKIVQSLFDAGEGPPLPELQFNVGDALFDSVCGEISDSRRNVFLTAPGDLKLSSPNELLESRAKAIITTIIAEKVTHTNRHLRQAALIWLFRMTKRSSDMGLQVVIEHLDSIQAAFINGLSESNEFAQDVASKGVGLAYSLASDEMKKKLVGQLVDALSTGRKPVVKLTEDTVLFEKGQLGKAPGGEAIGTYKEICALATDMNQPDLVYKFLSLASHNQTWNSKKGAAFGFGAVFEVARNELQPYLPSLVPKLYRYTYDPDVNVQLAMKSIWKEVTGTQKNVTDEYATEIMSEIRSSLTNKEWRVRESSCLALADLLSGHFVTSMCEDLGDLLVDLFRVQDDIKESTRLAALKALQQVERTVCRYSAEGTTTANTVIGTVLPVLVEKGIHSTVKATRMFGLRCVMRLGKEAGKSVKPFLKQIVPCLLESLSETEPSVLSYLSLRSDEGTREIVDDARSSAARTSPMMTSLNDFIPFIDEENYDQIAQILSQNLLHSCGLPTRNGSAQWLVNICLRLPNMLNSERCANSNVLIFRALYQGLSNSNPALRKQYASTVSYFLKYCPERSVKKVVKFIVESLVSTEEDSRQKVYHLLRGLVNQCHELVTDYNGQLLPVVFLTTFEKVPKGDPVAKKKHEDWLELWSDMIPGTESAIRMYSAEMIALALDLMKNNAVYVVRSNAAAMLTQVFQYAGSSFSADRADEIYGSIVEFLPGRIWDGKETVLNAVEALVSTTSTQLKKKWTNEELEQKFAPLFKETQKKNVQYKAQAIKAAVAFCQNLGYLDGAAKIEKFISELIAKKDEDDESSDDEETKHQKITHKQDFLAILAEWLARLLIVYPEESKIIPGQTIIINILQDSSVYWKVKHATVTGLQVFFNEHKFDHSFDITPLLTSVATVIKNVVLQRKNFASDTCDLVQKMITLNKTSDKVSLDVTKLKGLLEEVVVMAEMKASPMCEDAVRGLLKGYGEPMC
ncbi:hypothetical protein QR680_012067 [Steinernema hermaphroditum]|uniref:TOG domain-containing protein n=1 Tax=Steinernema hermaphroditum TaxID=289476 RepID=A0AA39LZW6_9BILA|nr:hypothetical protein QR680_012067 [Steinernema hermaphroditum]